jgi:outer membrane lipoprotein-sorting protein
MEENLKGSAMRNHLSHKYIVFIFLGLCLFLYPYLVSLAQTELQLESELSWVIKNIKDKEKDLNTFAAKFSQTKKTHLLKEPLHSEGLIYYDSASRMLLQVTSPSSLKVLLEDNMLFVYYPGLSKVEEKYLGRDNILKKYFGIGQSIEELEKQYEIQLIPKSHSDSYHLKLVPKVPEIARNIEMIQIVVSAKSWLLEQIHFKESEGDYTSIWLEFTSINESLPPGIFTIDLPEDREEGR